MAFVPHRPGAAEAREILAVHAIDLVLLDIMMPGEDGLSLASFIRSTSNIPLILVTAKTEDVDRIIGLEIGADDYVSKPFNPRELLARIKAVLRRTGGQAAVVHAPDAAGYAFGQWVLRTGERELVDAEGVSVALSTGRVQSAGCLRDAPKACPYPRPAARFDAGPRARRVRAFDRQPYQPLAPQDRTRRGRSQAHQDGAHRLSR